MSLKRVTHSDDSFCEICNTIQTYTYTVMYIVTNIYRVLGYSFLQVPNEAIQLHSTPYTDMLNTRSGTVNASHFKNSLLYDLWQSDHRAGIKTVYRPSDRDVNCSPPPAVNVPIRRTVHNFYASPTNDILRHVLTLIVVKGLI